MSTVYERDMRSSLSCYARATRGLHVTLTVTLARSLVLRSSSRIFEQKGNCSQLSADTTGRLVTVRKSQCRRCEGVLCKNITHCLVRWSKIALSKYEKTCI